MTSTHEKWNQVVTAVEEQAKLNFDLAIAPKDIRVGSNGLLEVGDESLGFNEIGLAQLARKIGIPAPYAAKLREQDPVLFGLNVRRWLHDANELKQDQPILIRATRTLQGPVVRSVLSDRYGILDNHEVVAAAVSAFEAVGLTDKLDIQHAIATPSSFHVRLSNRTAAIDAAKASGKSGFLAKDEDFLFPLLHLSNSEVGLASVRLDGGVYRVVCTNGLIDPVLGNKYAKRHYGKSQKELHDYIVKAAEDILSGAVEFTQTFAESQNNVLDPATVIENVENLLARNRVSKADERQIIEALAHPLRIGDLVTQYDVVNTITATARDRAPEDRLALERIASQFIRTN